MNTSRVYSSKFKTKKCYTLNGWSMIFTLVVLFASGLLVAIIIAVKGDY